MFGVSVCSELGEVFRIVKSEEQSLPKMFLCPYVFV